MKIGFGQGDITPRGGKIAVAGKIPLRYTDEVHDEIQAVAMIVETDETRTIWVSCDICHPTKRFTNDVIARLQGFVPNFEPGQLILNATHATACTYVTDDKLLGGGLDVELDQILPLAETRRQMCDGVEKAVREALANLQEAYFAYSIGEILTGFCRRTVYKDGTAVMYGKTSREDFLRMEYPDGPASQYLYAYAAENDRLLGIFAAVPCPSQADERNVYITGDYWTVVRSRVREALGADVKVLAACKAAGELSPHRICKTHGIHSGSEHGPEAAARMGDHIADSIIKEKDRPLKVYRGDELRHSRIATQITFPVRQPNEKERREAEAYFADPANFDAQGRPIKPLQKHQHGHVRKLMTTHIPEYTAKVHTLRLGDILFFTAPVELFTEYAFRISQQFPENPVIDVQLANDSIGYLPTKAAIAHGGYSTNCASTGTTPEGGELYIETISALLQELRSQ